MVKKFKIKCKCPSCLKEHEVEESFRGWYTYHLGTNFGFNPTCNECIKVLLKIGLARFSDISLEIKQQADTWIKFRDKLLEEETK